MQDHRSPRGTIEVEPAHALCLREVLENRQRCFDAERDEYEPSTYLGMVQTLDWWLTELPTLRLTVEPDSDPHSAYGTVRGFLIYDLENASELRDWEVVQAIAHLLGKLDAAAADDALANLLDGEDS